MALPTSRSTRNQEHALALAYALRGVLNTRDPRYSSVAQLEAVEEAQKALLAFKADNPSFSL
jgi:hypothetical protein